MYQLTVASKNFDGKQPLYIVAASKNFVAKVLNLELNFIYICMCFLVISTYSNNFVAMSLYASIVVL